MQRRLFLAATLGLTASMIGCSGGSAPGGVSVNIAASGLSAGKLALNASASFKATVTDYSGDPVELSFVWTLTTGNGVLSNGTNQLPNPSTGGNSISCVGAKEGDERITVGVLDPTGNVVATASVGFLIVAPTDPVVSRGCFDQPKIYYQVGSTYYVANFDGSGRASIGVSGGTTVGISPNGEWIAWNQSSSEGWDMWVQRCDGSERRKIEGGTSEDFLPRFSPDSKTLYFLRPEPSQPKPGNGGQRSSDIVAYDLATGELRFLTTVYPFGDITNNLNDRVAHFVVSPLTGELAFFRNSYQSLPSGGYSRTVRLSFVKPEGGAIREFTTLPQAAAANGFDWSPDDKDIIFSGVQNEERGIFRLNLTDGSKPLLLFPYPKNIVLPLYPHYYAGGSRIVYGGKGDIEQGVSNLWTIDANGNDLKKLTDYTGTEFMQGVLH